MVLPLVPFVWSQHQYHECSVRFHKISVSEKLSAVSLPPVFRQESGIRHMQVNREFSVEWEHHTNYGQRPKWAVTFLFFASFLCILKAGCPVREARPMAIHDQQGFGQAARKIRLTADLQIKLRSKDRDSASLMECFGDGSEPYSHQFCCGDCTLQWSLQTATLHAETLIERGDGDPRSRPYGGSPISAIREALGHCQMGIWG